MPVVYLKGGSEGTSYFPHPGTIVLGRTNVRHSVVQPEQIKKIITVPTDVAEDTIDGLSGKTVDTPEGVVWKDDAVGTLHQSAFTDVPDNVKLAIANIPPPPVSVTRRKLGRNKTSYYSSLENDIVLDKFDKKYAGKEEIEAHTVSTWRHEMAHDLDHKSGQLRKNQEFLDAYNKDKTDIMVWVDQVQSNQVSSKDLGKILSEITDAREHFKPLTDFMKPADLGVSKFDAEMASLQGHIDAGRIKQNLRYKRGDKVAIRNAYDADPSLMEKTGNINIVEILEEEKPNVYTVRASADSPILNLPDMTVTTIDFSSLFYRVFGKVDRKAKIENIPNTHWPVARVRDLLMFGRNGVPVLISPEFDMLLPDHILSLAQLNEYAKRKDWKQFIKHFGGQANEKVLSSTGSELKSAHMDVQGYHQLMDLFGCLTMLNFGYGHSMKYLRSEPYKPHGEVFAQAFAALAHDGVMLKLMRKFVPNIMSVTEKLVNKAAKGEFQ